MNKLILQTTIAISKKKTAKLDGDSEIRAGMRTGTDERRGKALETASRLGGGKGFQICSAELG